MLLDCIKKLLIRWLQLFVDLQLNVPVYVNILRTSGHDKICIHCLWNRKHKISLQICNKRHSFATFNDSSAFVQSDICLKDVLETFHSSERNLIQWDYISLSFSEILDIQLLSFTEKANEESIKD